MLQFINFKTVKSIIPSTFFNLQFNSIAKASRKKLLLKRKKINLKKLPISQKKFQELKAKKSISQIQQQQQVKQRLEHRPNINRNSYQLIQQLFFPDLKKSSSQVAQKAFTIQNMSAQAELEMLINEQNIKNLFKSHLNSELLIAYQTHFQQMNLQLIYQMIKQMEYNSKNIQTIKQKKLAAWNTHQLNLKKKNIVPEKCPLKFYDVYDIQKHPIWLKFLDNFIKIDFRLEQSQLIFKIIDKMNNLLGYIPYSIYGFIIENFTSKWKINQIPINIRGQLLRFISRSSNTVKYPKKIKITDKNILHQLTKKFFQEILISFSECLEQLDTKTFTICIETFLFGKQLEFPVSLFSKFQTIIPIHLTQLNLEKSIILFKAYKKSRTGSIQIFEIIKFNILRKLSHDAPKNFLLQLLKVFYNGKISFQNKKIQGKDLLTAVSEAIIRKLQTNEFNVMEIYNIICIFYSNKYNNINFFEFISTHLIKNQKNLMLQQFIDAFFKLTIVGIRSNYLRNEVLSRVINQFHHLAVKYREQAQRFLPNQKIQINNLQQIKSFQEKRLQDYLILFIWSYLKQCENTSQIKLDDIFKIFPRNQIYSSHPLIYEISTQINTILEQFNMFKKLGLKQITNQSVRYLDEMYRTPSYTNQIAKLLWKQVKLSKNFAKNMNLMDNSFVKLQWSSENAINQIIYKNWLISQKFEDSLYFRKNITIQQKQTLKNFFRWRNEIKQKCMKQKQTIDQSTKNSVEKVQYYEISEQQQSTH